MHLVRMEDPRNPNDRTLGAVLCTFASGKQRVITWQSDRPVNRKEMAAAILPRVIEGLHDDRTLDGQTDRREFNPASFLAALDGLLAEFNQRLAG